MNLFKHKLPESRLNYCATIGKEFHLNIFPLPNSNNVIFLGNDAFVFETDLFSDGKPAAFQAFSMLNIIYRRDITLYLFLLHGNWYTQKEYDGINMFVHLNEVFLSDYKVKLVKAAITREQILLLPSSDEPLCGYQPIKPPMIEIEKSGFLTKTPNGSNIFNLIFSIGRYVLLTTIIMRNFISREITTSILETIRKVVRSGNFYRLPQEDSLIHFPWCDYPYDSLNTIMRDIFIENLKDNESMQRAFAKLEDPNILINVRVIGREEDIRY